MEQIEPLISSSIAGPLGIAHLPRLWLKLLLHASGRLPEGYRAGEGGFDGRLFTHFGIDGDSCIAYIANERPDYLSLERWVVAHASDLTSATVTRWNLVVRSGQLGPERAAEWRERFGITDPTFAHANSLNDLDDWAGFHARLIEKSPA
jgi:hypothetical protein